MNLSILADAALPPSLAVLEFLGEHIVLVCGVVLAVAAITVVLIVLLKHKKGGDRK